MANLKQERHLRILADVIDETLGKMYSQKMGFLIVVTPFGSGDSAVSDYIGNIARDSAIEVLRESADRLEKNQDIPASVGGVM